MRKYSVVICALLLFLCAQFANAYQFTRNYSWGNIRTQKMQMCLEQKDGYVQFSQCLKNKWPQQWTLTGQGHLRYRAKDNHMSDECLDIPTQSRGTAHTRLQVYNCDESGSMKWAFSSVPGRNDQFFLRSQWEKSLNMCLTSGGEDKPITIELCDGRAEQIFELSSDALSGYDAFPLAALIEYKISGENWMEQIYRDNADIPLAQIIIPGTHNAATVDGFSPISTTQDRYIISQLNDGIRYLDLRLDARGKEGVVIVHGLESGPRDSAQKTLLEIQLFAQSHPKEIIFVDMQMIPKVSSDRDHDGIKNILDLAKMLKHYLGEFTIDKSNYDMKSLTLKKIWDNQALVGPRNIVLMTADYNSFATAKYYPMDLKYMWNRELGWRQTWPQSSDFDVIGKTVQNSLGTEKSGGWFMSQLIRTPEIGYVISSIFNRSHSVKRLTLEKAENGYFAHSIGKWLNDWVVEQKLMVNFIETDFYQYSNLVPMALWLNKAKFLRESIHKGLI